MIVVLTEGVVCMIDLIGDMWVCVTLFGGSSYHCDHVDYVNGSVVLHGDVQYKPLQVFG